MTEQQLQQVDLPLPPERLHARLGGSSAYRWVICPGSVFLLEMLPVEPPSDKMKAGTRLHEICEFGLNCFLMNKIDGTECDWKKQYPDYTEEEEYHVNTYIKRMWEDGLEYSLTGKVWGIEDHFSLDDRLGMAGYVDFWAIYVDERGHRTLLVVDYKSGYDYVPVKNNAQLIFYACAIRKELQANGKDIDGARLVIVQPKTENQPYREAKITSKQLDSWTKKFYSAAEQIYVKRKPKFKTGDHCSYCKAKALCKKYASETNKKMALKFIDPDIITLPEVSTLDDKTLSRVIINADLLESFIREAKVLAIKRYKAGNPVAGTKVIASSSRRVWLDDEQKVAAGLEALGVDPWQKKLKPITQLEKKLGRDTVNQFTTMSEPGLQVVSEADERQAVDSYKDKFKA